MKANSIYLPKLRETVMKLQSIRSNPKTQTDITLEDWVKADGSTMESFFTDLGVDPAVDTISNIVSMPDSNFRWLIPEIYRDALRLGLRKAPIYPNLIAAEEKVSQLSMTMPSINMSDAAPKKVGIAETIPLGDVSYGQKTVRIYKVGRGIQFPYELVQYVSINILSIYLQDFGVKLGMGLDSLALDTAINGDQADGSDSAAVIGITTSGTMVLRDLLRPFVRLSRLGKVVTTMVAGETMGLDILDLTLSAAAHVGLGAARLNVNVKSPIPQTASLYIHGKIPDNQVLMIDPSAGLIKLNAQPLLIEQDRIIANQVNEVYATITTGFATMFRDARVIMDRSIAYSGNTFPSYMDPTNSELVDFNAK